MRLFVEGNAVAIVAEASTWATIMVFGFAVVAAAAYRRCKIAALVAWSNLQPIPTSIGTEGLPPWAASFFSQEERHCRHGIAAAT